MWELLVFVALVVVPVLASIKQVPARLRDLRAGIRGIVYVPVVLTVLFTVAAAALVLAEYVPPLQWGWLGTNIVVAPLADLAPAPEGAPRGAGGGSGSTFLGPTLTLTLFVPFILLAFLVFNWYEEAYYRGSLRDVGIWAVLHLVMGIPIFAVLPIFAAGLVYKKIYDRRGLRAAYTAHLGTNVALLSVLVLTIVLAPTGTGAV